MVGIALYFYQQHNPDPSPVKIYNVPKLVPKQAPLAKTAAVKSPVSAVSSHIEREPLPDKQSQDMPAEQEVSETPILPVTDTSSSPPNEEYSDKIIEKWVSDVMVELEALDTLFIEKYPKLFEIGTLTKEEFLAKYPTHEEQQAILQHAKRVQPELLSEIRAIYSNYPTEILDDLLLDTEDHFVELWGRDTTDLVMRELRTILGL